MTHRTLFRTSAVALAALLAGTGCSPERVTAPSADVTSASVPNASAAKNTKGGVQTPTVPAGETVVPVLQRQRALKQDIVVTSTITANGGFIRIGGAGLIVYFAPGAVTQPLTVTATAHAGTSVAYSFEPHGTVFHAPVYVLQDLSTMNVGHDMAIAATINGAYMPDGLADLNADGTATVSEIHDAVVTKGRDFAGQMILKDAYFEIQHFSGYILTVGRNSGDNGR